MKLQYDVETNTVNYHLKKAFLNGELDDNSVIRNLRITASDRLYASDFDKYLIELESELKSDKQSV